MKDVAETLGVRASSLYNHVTSKQDMLFAIMDKAMDRALNAQEEALAGVSRTSPGSCGRPPSPWCWTSCATRPR